MTCTAYKYPKPLVLKVVTNFRNYINDVHCSCLKHQAVYLETREKVRYANIKTFSHLTYNFL